MNGPRISVGFTFLALLTTACASPRGFQVPVPYTVRAPAGAESMLCTKTALADLGFVFAEEADADKALGHRVRRGQEVARIELTEEDNHRVIELSIGITTDSSPLRSDSPRLDEGRVTIAYGGILSSPSRRTIAEADNVMARCQGSPLS